MNLGLSSNTYSNIRVFHHHHHRQQSLDLKMVEKDSNKKLRTPRTEKIIVIMGATGTGKSRLSIDLGTGFSPCEIINSDKMQIYKGLKITTNKIPMDERHSIPHHLIDEFDPANGELSPSDFRLLATYAVEDISSRNHLPILVGGSNSFIHAFLTEDFETDSDGSDFESVSAELRYHCCFLWIDVSLPVLKKYLCKRVDEMIQGGMFHEIAKFYESERELSIGSVPRVGIRKSIGISEFERFFRFFSPTSFISSSRSDDGGVGGVIAMMRGSKKVLFEEAVQAIKDNTYELAKKQIEKIQRLRSAGWDIQKLNATEVFRAVVESDSGNLSEIWEKEVVASSMKIVKQFLEE